MEWFVMLIVALIGIALGVVIGFLLVKNKFAAQM